MIRDNAIFDSIEEKYKDLEEKYKDVQFETTEPEMPDYYIFSGLPNQWFNGSLQEAMAMADSEIDYTDDDVCIFDATWKLVAFRRWVTDKEGMKQQGDDIIRLDVLGIYLPWETVQ